MRGEEERREGKGGRGGEGRGEEGGERREGREGRGRSEETSVVYNELYYTCVYQCLCVYVLSLCAAHKRTVASAR